MSDKKYRDNVFGRLDKTRDQKKKEKFNKTEISRDVMDNWNPPVPSKKNKDDKNAD